MCTNAHYIEKLGVQVIRNKAQRQSLANIYKETKFRLQTHKQGKMQVLILALALLIRRIISDVTRGPRQKPEPKTQGKGERARRPTNRNIVKGQYEETQDDGEEHRRKNK